MMDLVITYIFMSVGERLLPPMRNDFFRTLLAILIGFLFVILMIGALALIFLFFIRFIR